MGDDMKYRTTQPFLAFGKCANPGDVVELTEEQAAALRAMESITDYETKVMPLPENKAAQKKSSESLPAAPAAPKRTRKASVKKSKR